MGLSRLATTLDGSAGLLTSNEVRTMKFNEIKTLALGLCILASAIAITSCNETVNTALVERANSERNFKSFADSTGYVKVSLNSIQGDNFVYVKQLNNVSPTDDARKPLQTDRVSVHHRYYDLSSWVGQRQTPIPFSDNYDTPHLNPTPLMQEIPGIAIILQQMVVGQEVGVAIPWQLSSSSRLTGAPYGAFYVTIKLSAIEGE